MAIAFFIQSFALGVQAFLIREYKGVGAAFLGNLSMAFGFTLLLFRGILPDYQTIIIANMLLILGPNLYYIAISKFSGQKQTSLFPISIVTINALLLIYFTLVNENIPARNISVSILGMISTWLVVKQLWKVRHAPYRFSMVLILIPFSVYGVYLIIRAIMPVFNLPTGVFSKIPVESAIVQG